MLHRMVRMHGERFSAEHRLWHLVPLIFSQHADAWCHCYRFHYGDWYCRHWLPLIGRILQSFCQHSQSQCTHSLSVSIVQKSIKFRPFLLFHSGSQDCTGGAQHISINTLIHVHWTKPMPRQIYFPVHFNLLFGIKNGSYLKLPWKIIEIKFCVFIVYTTRVRPSWIPHWIHTIPENKLARARFILHPFDSMFAWLVSAKCTNDRCLALPLNNNHRYCFYRFI